MTDVRNALPWPRAARSPLATHLPLAAVAVAIVGVAACSGGMPSLTGGPSEVDRVFLIAAGNWDRNKDGAVTCDEWKAYATELFEAGDIGRKGHVTKEDWARVVSIDRMFDTVDFGYYDRNGDGKVDRSEFIERPNRAFEMADRNKDCTLTTVELTGARQAGAPAVKVVPAGSESGSSRGPTVPGGSGK